MNSNGKGSIELNNYTKIPLFAVLSVIPMLIVAMFWLTSIYSIAAEAQKTNDRQDRQIQNQTEILTDIRDRIIRIEEHLKQRGK